MSHLVFVQNREERMRGQCGEPGARLGFFNECFLKPQRGETWKSCEQQGGIPDPPLLLPLPWLPDSHRPRYLQSFNTLHQSHPFHPFLAVSARNFPEMLLRAWILESNSWSLIEHDCSGTGLEMLEVLWPWSYSPSLSRPALPRMSSHASCQRCFPT